MRICLWYSAENMINCSYTYKITDTSYITFQWWKDMIVTSIFYSLTAMLLEPLTNTWTRYITIQLYNEMQILLRTRQQRRAFYRNHDHFLSVCIIMRTIVHPLKLARIPCCFSVLMTYLNWQRFLTVWDISSITLIDINRLHHYWKCMMKFDISANSKTLKETTV